ncbi:hypothetical protein G9464_04600 [Halostella sp. JP-L12]|uniref:DUF5813 family protein n=1 Tax=Halostella TaxID=1843185 RepID=UPI000EF8119F|nr:MULTISPECIES: DUF5813 family protein [Halostella]NHN46875.1 hypothetical protein [Halostella sp. JP-L12]
MTDEDTDAARDALAAHGAFEPREDDFACTTTPFDAVVDVDPAEGPRDGEFVVSVSMPTLSAAVESEDVADVVEDGWYETLELRLEDAFDVAQTTTTEPVDVGRDGDEVRVELTFTAWDAEQGVDDAKALIDFVEGTYVQGIIPGYDYGDPVAQLRQAARQRGERAAEDDDSTGGRGGTPL